MWTKDNSSYFCHLGIVIYKFNIRRFQKIFIIPSYVIKTIIPFELEDLIILIETHSYSKGYNSKRSVLSVD